MIPNPEEIISNYISAYEAANGKPCPYAIMYERGWFTFRHSSAPDKRYRRIDLWEMTENLKERI